VYGGQFLDEVLHHRRRPAPGAPARLLLRQGTGQDAGSCKRSDGPLPDDAQIHEHIPFASRIGLLLGGRSSPHCAAHRLAPSIQQRLFFTLKFRVGQRAGFLQNLSEGYHGAIHDSSFMNEPGSVKPI
jgi:hypothetical protein